MRFFFRSRRFKILASIFAVLLVISIVTVAIGGIAPPHTNILGAIAAPFQKLGTSIANGFEDLKTAYSDGQALMAENERLRQENSALTSSLTDYQKTLAENEFYKDFLALKEEHPDFEFQPAMRISQDSTDPYGGFTIDKGSLQGIAAHDPVITAAGLVGYVSEVGVTWSKITTVLSPDLNAGGFDRRTRDAGILSGTAELAAQGKCRLYNLPRTAGVVAGDYIMTSGGGIFPNGLLVGKVEQVLRQEGASSIYAVVQPSADLENLRDVMVLTYFAGQGAVGDGGADE